MRPLSRLYSCHPVLRSVENFHDRRFVWFRVLLGACPTRRYTDRQPNSGKEGLHCVCASLITSSTSPRSNQVVTRRWTMRRGKAVPMRIRAYEAKDAALLAELLRRSVLELGPRHYTHEQVHAWASVLPGPARIHALAESRTTLIAVDEKEQPVAYGDLEADGHLDCLYCAVGAAGTGVASRVYEALEEHARTAGVARLFTEASAAARGLFLRHGFRVIMRRELVVAGVPIHNFAMEKLL